MSNFRGQITYSFVKCGYLICFFFNSKNLICQSPDISKSFRESLGLQDNESWLYHKVCFLVEIKEISILSDWWKKHLIWSYEYITWQYLMPYNKHILKLTVSNFAFCVSFSNLANSRLSWRVVNNRQIKRSIRPITTIPIIVPRTIARMLTDSGHTEK